MQIQFGLANFSPEWTEAVVCIGTFDGVHLGHCEVIRRAVNLARDHGIPCCLATFDRHPAATLRPDRCPPAILSLESRLEKFAALGVAITVVLPFDIQFSDTPAEQFLANVLIGKFKAKHVVVGHDFAMGRNRVGDAEWLHARIPTEIVPPCTLDGERISSSLVRRAVVSGNFVLVEKLLGTPFEISGVVVSGDRLGRRLGYPTANVARAYQQVAPPDGVYAGAFTFIGGRFESAISIGTRPAVGGVDRRIEAYCLNYTGPEFYGEPCRLELHRLIRVQEPFASLDDLIRQIERDVDQVRELSASRFNVESAGV
jgi:riboflavin kinase/FMN adenylyltransferase